MPGLSDRCHGGLGRAVAADIRERQGSRDAREHDEELLSDHGLPPFLH